MKSACFLRFLEEAARIRAEALALEEEQKQQRRQQRALGAPGAGGVSPIWRKWSNMMTLL